MTSLEHISDEVTFRLLFRLNVIYWRGTIKASQEIGCLFDEGLGKVGIEFIHYVVWIIAFHYLFLSE